ncbi:hypothetical protein [Aurantiacibacter hainanensis]|uniref:hypothetical protein n=1 Tax=Aurantiacibacter hainanensis TaxID=3076114 RepID=UPI0030C73EA9
MAERTFTDEQLALLLQASRDFAFQQIAEGMPMLPFASCVDPDGDMNFVRFAEPGTDKTPEEVLSLTHDEVRAQADKGALLAAGIVSGVRLARPEDGMEDAVRIEIEAPGFARQFLAFYRFEPDADGKAATVSPGKLVPFEAEAKIFADSA